MEEEEQEDLARLELLASMVSDSSESEESSEESDAGVVGDEAGSECESKVDVSVTTSILNTTELSDDDLDASKSTENDVKDVITKIESDRTEEIVVNDKKDDSAASTVSVTLPAGISETIILTDSQMDKMTASNMGALPSMSSLQDIFNSIESNHDTSRKSSGDYDGEEIAGSGETMDSTKDAVYEYYQLSEKRSGDDDLFSDYPNETLKNDVGTDFTSATLGDGSQYHEANSNKEASDDEDNIYDTMEDMVEEDSESSSSDEEMPADFSSLSAYCVNYMDHLSNMLGTLQAELERNQRRQQEIEEEVCELNNAQQSRIMQVKNQHVSVSKKSLTVFGFPYFKDQTLYHPPPNPDTIAKKQNKKELDPWIEFPKPFSKEDRKKLKSYVRMDVIDRRTSRICEEKEVLEHQIKKIGVRDEEKAELAEKIKDCDLRIREVCNMPEEKLFIDRYQAHDWDKISVTDFQVSHHPMDCQLQWQNLVHPSINKTVWSPSEDKMLKKLADATGGTDWDNIAKELETGRTPMNCFVRFMTKHNVAVNNRKWETSEDDRLRRLVAHCRINDFIPWNKVSYYMDRRTKDQCYQRYVYSLKDSIRKGNFTDAEDMILIIGEKLYGNDWAKICEMLPCRTPIQIHCRFNSFIKCEFKAWTQEEDLALLELVRKHGLRDWVVIASEMKGRWTRSQVRARFQLIYKNFKKNPAMALDNIVYTEDAGIAKKRQEEVFDGMSKRFQEWKTEEEKSEGDGTRGQEGKYGQSSGRSCGQIVLPRGEIINNRDLTRFIRYLQTFLPAPEPPRPLAPLEKVSLRTLPEHREEIFKQPVALGRNLCSKVRRGGLRPRRGGFRGRGRKIKNRDRLGSQNFKTKVDRDIAKFFRPTWISKSKLGSATRYTEKELELLVAAGQGVGNIIKVDKVKWDQNTHSNSVPDREMQLLQSFRYQQLYRQPSPQLQVETPSTSTVSGSTRSPFSGSSSVQRTYGRTYSRAKVKQSLSRSNTPVETVITSAPAHPKKTNPGDTINLVPPCQATMVGFRGMLLREPYLRDSNNTSDTVRQERDVVDNTMKLGINNPELLDFPKANVAPSEDQTAAHLAADRLLVSRIIQLFLWPAKMSTVDPPKQENLFSDSDDDVHVNNTNIVTLNEESFGNSVVGIDDSVPVSNVEETDTEDTPQKKRKVEADALQDLEQ